MKKWHDISSETERTYYYPEATLVIDKPHLLNIQPSSTGGHAHRIQTVDGRGLYIAPGWKAIAWRVREGLRIFTF